MTDRIRDGVLEHYDNIAKGAAKGESCCCDGPWGTGNYEDSDLEGIPAAAAAASIGCGNPMARADLQSGERVLDLGSGGGIDVLLSARAVGADGRAYGLDMSEEMLELARTNAAEAGADNVEFLFGYLEDIPLPDASIDVVISNCVINLSPDKPAVFAEMARVLRSGGRISISDVVTDDSVMPDTSGRRWAECIDRASSRSAYRAVLEAVGFENVSITDSFGVEPGYASAVIEAELRAKTTT